MIPAFDDNGYLPVGVHPATMREIAARFGSGSELRQVEMESVQWMVDLARRAGVQRIILNGGFVTDSLEPDDVDCVLLLPDDYPADAEAHIELEKGLPFIEMHMTDEIEFSHFVNRVYASDREMIPKGMIEVLP